MAILDDQSALAAFLDSTPVATFAVPVASDGTLHIATMHYWHDSKTLNFYFVTEEASEKCALLRDGGTQKAAVVVGTDRGTPFTLQMRGVAQIVSKDEYAFAIDGYTSKRGNSHDVEHEGSVLLQFHPTWARFTDYAQGYDRHQLPLE